MTDPLRRRIVLFKASRETVVLLACVTALTFALAHAAHRRSDGAPPGGEQAVQQGWAGQLADVAPDTTAPHAPEPLTSASLVVPVAALPAPPAAVPGAPVPGAVRQAVPAKARPCDQPTCAPTVKLGPPNLMGPAPKQVASVEPDRSRSDKEGASLIGKLNPLKHLPDAVRHPFDTAGDAVSSWIKRL